MVSTTFKNLPEVKKKKIEAALIKEFGAYPLHDAQVARIVKDAGIARGAFYKYFDDLKDAYHYVFAKAMRKIHQDRDADIYETVASFVERVDMSPYRDMIKLHWQHDPQKVNPKLAELDAKTWARMILAHSTIRECLFDPDNRETYLKRLKEIASTIEKKA
ncbi:MAG: TetR/AcrR family transcriptional regulator [Lactobacillus sp.]|nr:TetR/AcrR family transcriptional regulator [Lactobacillus sp.]